MIDEKKKAVIKSAEFLFATNGFNQTTVADIAKESGIHAASIYSYFNNKRNLLFAIYGKYLQNAVKSLNEHFQGMKEPGPKLRKAIWHYLADMKNSPNYARILIMAQRENPEFYSSEYVKYVKRYSGLVLKNIIAGQKDGLFRTDITPRLIRNISMGTSVFAAFDSIVHECPYDPNELSDVIYQLVLRATGTQATVTKNNNKLQRSERTELRRAQILKTAIKVFSSKGFSRATISDVAKQASLGDATLYEYFDSKEAILLGAAESYLQNLVSDEDINRRDLSGPEKALRKMIWRWIWQLYTCEEFSRVLILELFRNIKFYSTPGY
ncbi:MAG: TetR/AcrR family transcriptional regulator, partial [Deltaproteobacteria bacterium]|nr:TetR/AcrR family transcriptional regulator [Deltaproteobacteria bacterium]